MLAAGLLLGIGLEGFVDGIVLHQILQGHHLLSSEGGRPASHVAGLEANTLADGLSMPSRGWPCVPASGCCGGWAVEPRRPPGADGWSA
jgi:hypothetical protein